LRLEIRYLAERMDSGIGAAGAMNLSFFLRNLSRDVRERALNRRHARLHLPAVEFRPVVGQRKFDIAHPGGAIIARWKD